MQASTHTIDAEVTTYRDDLGHVIGRVYVIDTTNVRLFVGEAHDWDNSEDGIVYDPIGIGTFVESTEPATEIARRAQLAQS